MPELCASLNGETVCMPVDLTVFEDPRQGEVREPPGDAPGELEPTGAPAVRTRVAWGAVPDAWPRDERVAGELVKGQERISCELLVRTTGEPEDHHALDLVLLGKEVFLAIMGRDP